MTPERRAAETRRKSAERQRRREAGEVRVECWLSADMAAWLDAYGQRTGLSRNDCIRALIMREELRSMRLSCMVDPREPK